MGSNLVEIFYLADEFCREFDKAREGHILQKDFGKKSRNHAFRMSDSEVITILIYFHLKQFKNLKPFHINCIQVHCRDDFPQTVSYSCFVELQQKALLPLTVFLQLCCPGKCTGISFIDSTPLRACHIKGNTPTKHLKVWLPKEKHQPDGYSDSN